MPKVVDEWATRLTGLPAARIEDARERLDALGIDRISDELCRRPDVDAVAGACMLVSALDVLIERGVPEANSSPSSGATRRSGRPWPRSLLAA
jgi:hypothetical protein